LVAAVAPDVTRICARLATESGLADDAIQETFLQLRDHAGKFRAPSDEPDNAARRWISCVAANVTLKLLRRRRSETMREQRAAAQTPTTHDEIAGATLMRTEAANRVREELAKLPEAMRTALVLHLVEGLGFDHIADTLKMPVGTAKSRVH